MPEKIDRLPAVVDTSGLSRTSIYRMGAEGTFPKPIKLGVRSSGWIHSEVQQWVDERIRSSRQGGKV